jgi:cell fate regulator YaaT (PSP1 superfamily)
MAKEQNLSLNPVKISGTCGRLMCCLNYEQDAYEDLQKTTPRVDSIVETPAGRGRVTDVNLLRGQIKVMLDSQPDTQPKTFDKAELKIIKGAHCGGCRKEKGKDRKDCNGDG